MLYVMFGVDIFLIDILLRYGVYIFGLVEFVFFIVVSSVIVLLYEYGE